MTTSTYIQVQPREHSPECERGHKSLSDGPCRIRLDAPCERCRNLWARLDEVSARRKAAS